MSHKNVPYVPSTGWDIFKLGSERIIGLRFEHASPTASDVFHGLTLDQAKQLISDLQMHADYLGRLSEK